MAEIINIDDFRGKVEDDEVNTQKLIDYLRSMGATIQRAEIFEQKVLNGEIDLK